MKEFDIRQWNHKKCTNKEEANKEIERLGIIGDSIEEIIILDEDKMCNDKHYLLLAYENRVINKDINNEELKAKIIEFRKNHKEMSVNDFPDDFKYECATYSKMPLILKMKSGKQFELLYWNHFEMIGKNPDNKNETWCSWQKELLVSSNELKEHIKEATPIMDYNKLYSFILNQRIVDINYDEARYFNIHNNKLDENDEINRVNIEFENGYVMQISNSGPNNGFFIVIFDIKNQTCDNFSIHDFMNCFLGDINDINHV